MKCNGCVCKDCKLKAETCEDFGCKLCAIDELLGYKIKCDDKDKEKGKTYNATDI